MRPMYLRSRSTLQSSPSNIGGEPEALRLAVRPIKELLSFFVESGGKLFWEQGGKEISVSDIFWDEDPSSGPEPITRLR